MADHGKAYHTDLSQPMANFFVHTLSCIVCPSIHKLQHEWPAQDASATPQQLYGCEPPNYFNAPQNHRCLSFSCCTSAPCIFCMAAHRRACNHFGEYPWTKATAHTSKQEGALDDHFTEVAHLQCALHGTSNREMCSSQQQQHICTTNFTKATDLCSGLAAGEAVAG
jgi:hypothetical protein